MEKRRISALIKKRTRDEAQQQNIYRGGLSIQSTTTDDIHHAAVISVISDDNSAIASKLTIEELEHLKRMVDMAIEDHKESARQHKVSSNYVMHMAGVLGEYITVVLCHHNAGCLPLNMSFDALGFKRGDYQRLNSLMKAAGLGFSIDQNKHHSMAVVDWVEKELIRIRKNITNVTFNKRG